MTKGLEHPMGKERQRELERSGWRGEGSRGLTHAYKYLTGGHEEDGARLCSVVPHDRARGLE